MLPVLSCTHLREILGEGKIFSILSFIFYCLFYLLFPCVVGLLAFFVFVDSIDSLDALKNFKWCCIPPHASGGSADARSSGGAIARTPPAIQEGSSIKDAIIL